VVAEVAGMLRGCGEETGTAGLRGRDRNNLGGGERLGGGRDVAMGGAAVVTWSHAVKLGAANG
jgi:hypothetical protein